MSFTDFEEWVTPSLELTLRGCTYVVRPPSVEAGKKIAAAAVRGEIRLGMIKGVTEVPEEIQRVLDTIGADEHPALGETWAQMHEAGLDRVTIDRAAYYAVFYWARGKDYADSLAKILWAKRDVDEPADAGDADPKA
ncbi:hypothetical protein HF576_01875 [Microbacterium sp. CFH 90308]|uniref:DUF7426 domain-containing protein n=1 Tax=Microbacterium salsuginis TaxID=2722803 RepID=A0ABX1K6H7_9MICO|nr:hypothetical protein [Microbacterium sp. CFH 90308]NLP82587.1 hypothetical protein [Microbacterium sp. CFH 90308]